MKHTVLGAIMTLASLSVTVVGDPVIQESFDKGPANTPWVFENGDSGAFVAGQGTDNLCITATNGAWRGPMMTLEPYEYYHLTFNAKADSKCYWLINYYRTDGTEHPVDHYNCFEPSTEWQPKEFYFRCINDVTNGRLAFRPMGAPAFVDDVVLEKADRSKVIEWADKVYADMPPLSYTPSPDRWALIPKTMAALQAGKKLHVVMLGDSIVNDTANSAYDVRIEKMYPGSRWEIVHSIRGSTGCVQYKENNRTKEMVLDCNPDFLMIGGISNGDAESVRTVIHQIRAVLPDLEILVMSGPIGRVNPFTHPEWTSEPQPGEYRTLVAQVATEEHCEFLDMETIWGNYVKNSGKTWEYFTRDELHGNSQGRQVLSKILEAFFAPKTK